MITLQAKLKTNKIALLLFLFYWSCNVKPEVVNENSNDTQYILIQSSNHDIITVKKVILKSFKKKSRFNELLNIDTINVWVNYNESDTSSRYTLSIAQKAKNFESLYSCDYEIIFENTNLPIVRYSDVVLIKQEVYGGVAFYIDSFSCNGVKLKNVFCSNCLGF